MIKIQVYDPPLCCSTGVCGPSPDPALVRFAADVEWAKGQGVAVERFNLAQQPAAFVENRLVSQTLTAEGNGCLPLILAEGRIAVRGAYPARSELARIAGLHQNPVSSGKTTQPPSSCCGASVSPPKPALDVAPPGCDPSSGCCGQ